MILDTDAVINMAQTAANNSNNEQCIYRRKSGEFIFCAKGNVSLIKQFLKPDEQLEYIQSVKPEGQP